MKLQFIIRGTKSKRVCLNLELNIFGFRKFWHKNRIFGIRLFTFLILLGTFIVACWGICVNSTYYRNTIRPYLKCVPKSNVEVETGKIKYEYTSINKGKTPAFEVRAYSVMTMDDSFPESLFIERIIADTTPTNSIIFQNENAGSNLREITITKKDSTPVLKDTIIERIIVERLTIFLYFYISYFDVNNYPYYFRHSLRMSPSENFKKTGSCNWYQIDVSEKPIIVKTKKRSL